MSANVAPEMDQLLQQMRYGLRPLGLGALLPLTETERAGLDFYKILMPPELGEQSVGYFQQGGERIALYRFRPRQIRGSCFLLHGYYDHVGLYGHMIRFLLQQGLEVVAIDLPGHGLSGGERATIEEFAHYGELLSALLDMAEQASLPKPWLGMGQSTGAGVLADTVLGVSTRPLPFDQLILLAPLLRPRNWPMARLLYRLLKPVVREIPRSYSANSSDEAFLEFVRHQDPLQPRTLPVAWVGALSRWIPRMLAARVSTAAPLIVQGQQDFTVDWRFNIKTYTALFPAARVHFQPTAGHHLANESESLRQHYLPWIAQHLMINEGGGAEVDGYTRGKDSAVKSVELSNAE
ncbi:alpha/beta hydrolase [Aestuariirhabdus sp. Z084]|uniref:alpha/beta hydrolase n=1 Tax=Aestuariirhabdus haliotis TaxID=2918751 RepID=UPI00201B3D1D|nr:alpha/beta hydrolase [Aestuariirhabdus haliotis]MCL6414108.1 alpha/beta hydrolase [Aestuariirhabdus haliotis]MCL6418040.1 alpha/beta hydrolase [Aestuariirhabdus haliotis]